MPTFRDATRSLSKKRGKYRGKITTDVWWSVWGQHLTVDLGKGWSISHKIRQIRANFGLEIRLQIISQVDYNVCLRILEILKKKEIFWFCEKKKGNPFLKGKVASLNFTIKQVCAGGSQMYIILLCMKSVGIHIVQRMI